MRRHLTFSNVAAAAALFISIAGGTAIAGGALKVRSADIVDGTIKTKDVRKNGLTGRAIDESKLKGVDAGTLEGLRPGDLQPSLRGQMCSEGEVVVGISAEGNLVCADPVGGGEPGTDADGDGITVEDGDCDDGDPDVGPGFPEVPFNGKDDDCDPSTPDEDPDLRDLDEDGFTPADGDCDDTDSKVYPGADEVPGNGIDDDCDGFVDE